MEWSDKLSVGVDHLDSQHRKIIDYINEAEKLTQSVGGGAAVEVANIRELIAKIADYTQSHFHDEETLMARHNMRDLKRHREIHENLITQVKNLSQKVETHGAQVLPIVVKFLQDWLQTHILGVDKGYATIIGKREAP